MSQSVFKRQEIVRIQLQKMEEKKAAELVANEKRLADIEAERVARAKQALGRSKAPVTTTTTTTTTTYQQPVSAQPRRIGAITPASNILAMQRAKEKIDLIRAAKQPTISRTVSKAVGRVAHATSVTAEVRKTIMFVFIFYISICILYLGPQIIAAGVGAKVHQNLVQHSHAILHADGETLPNHLRRLQRCLATGMCVSEEWLLAV